MKIIPLSEGSFTVDASKKFVPFKPDTDELQDRNRGSLLVEIQPFVIITQKDIILLDAGLGMLDENGSFQIYSNLKAHNIYPDDVTKVIMSHLHKDHIGGLINPFTKQLSFEQADYYVQEKELDDAFEKGNPSYETENLEILKNSDKLHLLTDDEGTIDGYVHYEITGAHAKYHQVIWIAEDGETVFFGADDAPQLSQMKRKFAAKYDYDGKKAMELREKWWQQGNNEGWFFVFYHDTKHPVYKSN
ncbi:MAG: MBL fold metallo-hydrolase [Niabella sp.]